LQGSSESLVEAAGAEVLVVEDDGAIRRLILSVLARGGLRPAAARDGVVAVEMLRRHKFTTLLLDLMMPRMSGWDVLGWLEDHPQFRPRSVIIISACTPDVVQALAPSVVNAVVPKPFDVHKLVDYVKRCCRATFDVDRRVKRVIGAA